MLVIIEAIVTVFVAVLLTAFVVWFFFVRNQSESNFKEVVYIIHFKSDIPDISKNAKIMDKVAIIENTADGYVVHSSINDSKLHQLITQEYALEPKQVYVHSKIFAAMPL